MVSTANVPARPCGADRPPTFTRRLIQGVEYFQHSTADGGDLFLTRYGIAFAAQLQPENWFARPWFEAHRRRLRGTSAIYRTQTKSVAGRALNLVVRFNRVGEDIPIDTGTRAEFPDACFNSPFEEFANLMAVRAARFGWRRRRIATKRPLAIYSPPVRLEAWQTGRSETQMAVKQAQLPEVRLDSARQYILVYGWTKGIDAQDAAEGFAAVDVSRQDFLAGVVEEVEAELGQAGFRMLDIKPAHVIVRFTPNGRLLRRRDGTLVYALVDYELLEPAAYRSGRIADVR